MVMLRPLGKATKIAQSVLGKPLKDTEKKKRIKKSLIIYETKKVR